MKPETTAPAETGRQRGIQVRRAQSFGVMLAAVFILTACSGDTSNAGGVSGVINRTGARPSAGETAALPAVIPPPDDLSPSAAASTPDDLSTPDGQPSPVTVLSEITFTPALETEPRLSARAAALRGFYGNGAVGTGVVLADLDGDGTKEMMAYKLVRMSGSSGYLTMIVGIFNEKYPENPLIHEEGWAHKAYGDTSDLPDVHVSLYLSETNYFIAGLGGQDEQRDAVYLPDRNQWIYLHDHGSVLWYTLEELDGTVIEVSESEYRGLYAAYGIDKPKTRVFDFRGGADQTDEIFGTNTGLTLTPAPLTVYVGNGSSVFSFEAYNIENRNYIKLRDAAYALNGTEKSFDISWDAASGVVTLTPGVGYTPVGSELRHGGGQPVTATPRAWTVASGTGAFNISAYLFDDGNLFLFRDIMRAVDVRVEWDAALDAIRLDPSAPYGG